LVVKVWGHGSSQRGCPAALALAPPAHAGGANGR
jgi:hypothetical protein